MIGNKSVSLAITSSRRIHLLRMALKSFTVFCKDLPNIDNVMFFDDSSSTEDKKEMEELIDRLFPNQNKSVTHFYPESFPDGYRHSRILNTLRRRLIEAGTDYFFLLEDDYLFVNHFSVSETIDLLEKNEEYAYAGFSQSYKNFPEHINPKIIGDWWEWYYDPNLPINCSLFLDDVSACQTMIPNFWMYYINWPSFSLRPGTHHVGRFLSVGEFSTSYDTENMRTELEFSIRWAKKYKSLFHRDFFVVNLAWEASKSSYSLNNSN